MIKRPMREGEVRRIRPNPKTGFASLVNSRVEVHAHLVDFETPRVRLTTIHHLHGDETTVCLEDVVAKELIHMLRRALDILPTSK